MLFDGVALVEPFEVQLRMMEQDIRASKTGRHVGHEAFGEISVRLMLVVGAF